MISVIIPALNAATTLPDCLQALAAQRDPGQQWEIIVVDDGSHDDTARVATAHGATVLRHPQPRGAAAARNSGVAQAQGEIICFTDADCAPTPDWLQQMIRPLADPQIAGCKGIYATQQRELVARFVQIEYEDKYDLLHRQQYIDFVDTYSAAYRRTTLIENGGFDTRIFYVEDQELSFRLAARGYQMVFQPDAVVYHRHSASLAAYVRKKIMIGYWKVQIIRRFPARAVKDSHTPQVLKLQMLLTAALLMAGAGSLLFAPLFIVALLAGGLFLVSTVPFVYKAWRKDPLVAVAAPPLLLARALALGVGTFWGLVRPRPIVPLPNA